MAVQAAVAALVATTIFVHLAQLRPPQSHLWGDEGTYVAMTASLVRDLDLSFTETDRAWALERGGDKGVAVILHRTQRGITYSKPVLYPLLAALPYRLFGETGMVLLNVVALATALFFAWLFLRRIGSGGHLWLTLVLFAGYAALAPYLLWRMSESLQIGLATAGLALACGGLRQDVLPAGGRLDRLLEHAAAPWVGGALLGLLASLRTTNALLIAGAAFACLLVAGWRRGLAVGAGAAVALAIVLALSLLTLGTASPYTTERASFNGKIGYPVGADAERSIGRLDDGFSTHRLRFEIGKVSLYSAYYFLVGRHSGLLAYFPLALVLMYLLARHPDRLGLALLGTTLALTLFYLVYMPRNYFGGSTFIGNRYFLISYPALLIGSSRLPSPKLLAGTLAVGLLFGASAVQSVRLTRDLDSTSQSHTAAGAFLRLPYESTAIQIQGQKSRFWSRDYVRFTSAVADVQRNRFTLHSDRPAAELMIASRQPREQFFFLVRPAAVVESIEWRDWARSGSVRPQQSERAERGLVSFRPASPWRRHRFWWRADDPYDVRLLQLELRAAGGEPQQVDVFYLGGSDAILDSARRTVVEKELPESGVAGGSGTARVRVRNTSDGAWLPEGVLPVTIGYRIHTREGVVSTRKRPIPSIIERGGYLDVDLEIEWPDEPGAYRLVVDLALHPVYWFAEKLGEPLAARWLEIKPAREPPLSPGLDSL